MLAVSVWNYHNCTAFNAPLKARKTLKLVRAGKTRCAKKTHTATVEEDASLVDKHRLPGCREEATWNASSIAGSTPPHPTPLSKKRRHLNRRPTYAEKFCARSPNVRSRTSSSIAISSLSRPLYTIYTFPLLLPLAIVLRRAPTFGARIFVGEKRWTILYAVIRRESFVHERRVKVCRRSWRSLFLCISRVRL